MWWWWQLPCEDSRLRPVVQRDNHRPTLVGWACSIEVRHTQIIGDPKQAQPHSCELRDNVGSVEKFILWTLGSPPVPLLVGTLLMSNSMWLLPAFMLSQVGLRGFTLLSVFHSLNWLCALNRWHLFLFIVLWILHMCQTCYQGPLGRSSGFINMNTVMNRSSGEPRFPGTHLVWDLVVTNRQVSIQL